MISEPIPGSAGAVSELGLEHLVSRPNQLADNAPVILLVHGRRGDERVMWTFTRTLSELSPMVISVRACLPDPGGGHSWWIVDERGTPVSEVQLKHATHCLGEFVKRLSIAYPETSGRPIIAFGFSQGAATLLALALEESELFAGVAVLAGFLPQIALTDLKLIRKLPPIFMAHGTADEIISFSSAERARDKLIALGVEVTFVSEAVGHKVGIAGMKALKAWLSQLGCSMA